MSRRKARKRKHSQERQKSRSTRLGKVIQRGPLRVSQWGSGVFLENLSTPEQQQEIERHLADTYPKVCCHIDECVQRLCAIVRAVDPISLLQRAYWHVVYMHLGQGP